MKTAKLLRDVHCGSTQRQTIPMGTIVEVRYDGCVPTIVGTAVETLVEHAVTVGWQDIIGPGVRVEAGDDGEDHDTETVDSTTATTARVRWDSLIVTDAPMYTLRVLWQELEAA